MTAEYPAGTTVNSNALNNSTVNKETCEKMLETCATSVCNEGTSSNAELLNRDCFCKTFDREKFNAILNTDELHRTEINWESQACKYLLQQDWPHL